MNGMTCAEARSLIAIEDDDARPDADALRRHLAVCDDCAGTAPELSLLLSLTPPRTVPAERFRPRIHASGAAAAAVLLAVLFTTVHALSTPDEPLTLDVGAVLDGNAALVLEEPATADTFTSASVVRSVHGAGVESVLTFEVSSEPTRGSGRQGMEWIR